MINITENYCHLQLDSNLEMFPIAYPKQNNQVATKHGGGGGGDFTSRLEQSSGDEVYMNIAFSISWSFRAGLLGTPDDHSGYGGLKEK